MNQPILIQFSTGMEDVVKPWLRN